MAELAEWSAQVLRCQGSDGPVKVMYFRNRPEVGTNESFDQYCALRNMRPELGKQSISFKLKSSGESDTQAVFSGHLFDPVEVLDSKNYKLQSEESFEDIKSALKDLASKYNNIPRIAPFDLESIYGPHYIGPRFIQPSEEEDLRWYNFIDYATNARDIKIGEKRPDKKEREEFMKEGEGKGKGKGGGGGGGGGRDGGKKQGGKKKEEKKEEKKEDKDKEKKEDKDKEKKRRKAKEWLEEFDGVTYRGVRVDPLCAFIFGITTEFNPSGMWIVEDFFYDEEEVANIV